MRHIWLRWSSKCYFDFLIRTCVYRVCHFLSRSSIFRALFFESFFCSNENDFKSEHNQSVWARISNKNYTHASFSSFSSHVHKYLCTQLRAHWTRCVCFLTRTHIFLTFLPGPSSYASGYSQYIRRYFLLVFFRVPPCIPTYPNTEAHTCVCKYRAFTFFIIAFRFAS